MTNNAPKQDISILSRYTTWQAFNYWLKNSKIVFGNYTHWEDKSDVTILNAYEKYTKKQIRLICLMDYPDGLQDCYYHWKNYASGNDGIRIDFDKNMLINTLKSKRDVEIHRDCVKYPNKNEKIRDLAKNPQYIPFIKRASYEGDREFRFICLGNSKVIKKGYPYEYKVKRDFFKNCIKGIRFSPLMTAEKLLEIKSILNGHKINENAYFSKIFRYENWESIVLNGINPSTIGDKK